MKGFINLIKPEGMSSAYAVGAVKRTFHLPCGHMGTLDPMASGALPVGLDKTCRLFPYLLDKKKVYRAKFRFGILTDTLDITGEVQKTSGYIPDIATVNAALPQFIGKIAQTPPKYSAKCVDGKRGYQLARKGVEFTLEKKEVTVYSFVCEGQTDDNEYEFTIECGGGTYIRSLARDLGEACGTFGTMSALCRTASGIFSTRNGVGVEELKNSENPEKYLIKPELALDFPELVLSRASAKRILDGIFDYRADNDGLYKVFCEDDFWGVGEVTEGILRIKAYVR